MTAKQTAAYSGGGLLLLAWLASASGLVRQAAPVVESQSPVETSGTTTLAADVQAQTARLRTRLSAAPAPQQHYRNPFAFAKREPSPSPQREKTREATTAPLPTVAAPDDPAIDLVGVAENRTEKGLERSAIVSALSGELFIVKEGELIAARYRVKAIDKEAVELTDVLTGASRRLTLRQ
jgi:hypothetical protein